MLLSRARGCSEGTAEDRAGREAACEERLRDCVCSAWRGEDSEEMLQPFNTCRDVTGKRTKLLGPLGQGEGRF